KSVVPARCSPTFVAITLALGDSDLPLKPADGAGQSEVTILWPLDARVRLKVGLILLALVTVPQASAPTEALAEQIAHEATRDLLEARAGIVVRESAIAEAQRRRDVAADQLRPAEEKLARAEDTREFAR